MMLCPVSGTATTRTPLAVSSAAPARSPSSAGYMNVRGMVSPWSSSRIIGSLPRARFTALRCSATGPASRIVAAQCGPTRSSVLVKPISRKSFSCQVAIAELVATGTGGAASRLASSRSRLATSRGCLAARTIATAPPILCAMTSAPSTPAAVSAAATQSA